MSPPRNRKQRRAAATESIATASDIPLSIPSRDDPSTSSKEHRTLYDIIEERQNELRGQIAGSKAIPASTRKTRQSAQSTGTRFVTVDASGALVETDGDISSEIVKNTGGQNIPHSGGAKPKDKNDEDDSETDEPLPPFLDTVLLSVPLTTLHLTLAYLAAYMYAESTNVPRLVKDAVTTTFPLLTFLVHFIHGHIVSFRLPRWSFLNPQPVYLLPLTRDKFTFSFLRRLILPPTLRTIVFLPVAVTLGMHLITITNEQPNYAVMKKAPAYGTVWIWCILEMTFGPAVLGSLGPLIWGVWWMGYGIV
ncbi:uncharacterized protein N7484_004724 [Penicillium longicatenatum]|uniref:uncharacterized protein n=1 Tax=Penicillium longicatenatum TaxID=1561947 RepID=UPI0025496826|nr:uncharacterized protein N7484_004724 [Penicillium longicatenatum]KAJ5651001.1 hypothetical protein N7484_004724 [Penicillium longicatenatum]